MLSQGQSATLLLRRASNRWNCNRLVSAVVAIADM